MLSVPNWAENDFRRNSIVDLLQEMKKFLLAAMAALLFVSASAQDLLRYNYKKNNYIYTGTERVRVVGTTPLEVKLNRVTFPDGENIYILRVEYEEATAWKMPKNAPYYLHHGRKERDSQEQCGLAQSCRSLRNQDFRRKGILELR